MLRAYDGHPSTPVGLYQNFPVNLAGKTVLIDIKFLDAQLDYNILLGHSYMYAMIAITSSVFRVIMFPHDDWIITIDQLTYYDKKPMTNLDFMLPYVETTTKPLTWYTKFSLGNFKLSSILGEFLGDAPI